MITYLKGDATVPQAKGPKIITHVVNTLGGWGSGFVVAISNRWTEPERCYREWYHYKKLEGMRLQNPTKGRIISTTNDFKLGEVQLVQVLPDTYVLNMIAQQGMGEGSSGPPIRYKALASCLYKARFFSDLLKATVHMPRIGCGLAGGRWEMVEPLVTEAFGETPVYCYDLK